MFWSTGAVATTLLCQYISTCQTGVCVLSSVQFSSRWYLCAWKSPYALHPICQKFPQHHLWNDSNVWLIDNGPLSSFQGRLSGISYLMHMGDRCVCVCSSVCVCINVCVCVCFPWTVQVDGLGGGDKPFHNGCKSGTFWSFAGYTSRTILFVSLA